MTAGRAGVRRAWSSRLTWVLVVAIVTCKAEAICTALGLVETQLSRVRDLVWF